MGNITNKERWGRAIAKAAEPWRLSKVQKLIEAFRLGSNVDDALHYARLSSSTYYLWLKKYPLIVEELEEAKLYPIVVAQGTLNKGLAHDTRLAFEYLKTKRSADYAPTKVALEGSLDVKDGTSPHIAAAVAAGVGEALKKLNAEANKKD